MEPNQLIPSRPINRRKIYVLAAIRDGVIFPHSEVVLTFGRPRSVKAVEQSFQTDRQIVFVTRKTPDVADPKKDDLYEVGVLATIERTLKTNEEINALVKGLHRVKIGSSRSFDRNYSHGHGYRNPRNRPQRSPHRGHEQTSFK